LYCAPASAEWPEKEEYIIKKITVVITTNHLEKLNACLSAIEWMRETYPLGAPLTAETLATVPNKRWIVWFASKRHSELRFVWAGVALRHMSRRHPSALVAEYADKVTADNSRRAREAAEAADADARAAYARLFESGDGDAIDKAYADARADESALYAVYNAAIAVDDYADAYDAACDAARAAAADADEVWSEMANISVRYLLME
jgi:hypothetical protein